jgi:hypothetical protein
LYQAKCLAQASGAAGWPLKRVGSDQLAGNTGADKMPIQIFAAAMADCRTNG